jgi:hypothetical protein
MCLINNNSSASCHSVKLLSMLMILVDVSHAQSDRSKPLMESPV